MMHFRKILVVLLVTIILFTACQSLTNQPHTKTDFMMGTVVNVKVYDEQKEDAVSDAFARMEQLSDRITTELETSEISKINNNAGIQPVQVTDEIFHLIRAGKQYSDIDGGGFDITIGPLTNLWRIGHSDARKPEQHEIDEILPLIQYRDVTLDEKQNTVMLKRTGMKLDLGAIAKGYITDEVVKVLHDHEVTTAIVDLGGNIYVLGDHPSGNPWTVAIQDPFAPRGNTLGKLQASNQSIVTSGIYERYLEVDGVKYHHLLNPKDGYPFNNELASVTIVSDLSIDGDALSTVAFSMGLERALKYIESLEGIEAIIVTMDKKVFKTSGLENFEITNDDFQWG